MRHLSLKMKVTIWYTTFVVLIASLALLVVAQSVEQMIVSDQEEELREDVTDFAEDLEIFGGTYMPEDGIFYDEDVAFSIYNNAGELLEGTVPADFPQNTTLKNFKIQKVSSGEMQWLTYDIALDLGQGELIWIRGIMYMGRAVAMENFLILLVAILLPILVILAAVGGYLITKRAFAPIEQIRKAAQEIAGGGDLKRRVPVEEAKGELKELSRTFNGMLDTIEKAFENERQFTADASHELRTPISVVIAQSEYGVLEDTTDEERREALEVVLGQGKKMSSLVSQLLDISRSENNNRKDCWAKVDVGMVGKTDMCASGHIAKRTKLSVRWRMTELEFPRKTFPIYSSVFIVLTRPGQAATRYMPGLDFPWSSFL